uniref:Uncharacterized protein n=1 Tax=Knipowitschia caucasica TaxID=637954 RepID=A0AAV2JWI4_KNICA
MGVMRRIRMRQESGECQIGKWLEHGELRLQEQWRLVKWVGQVKSKVGSVRGRDGERAELLTAGFHQRQETGVLLIFT